MMDLRRLGHLVALADERRFARAAMQVHLSQPAFSRSIQALERDMGQRLFERETGEVRPTPAGAFLIDRARRLLFDARIGAGIRSRTSVSKAALAALLKLPPGQDPPVALACDDLSLLCTLALETDTVLGATHVSVQAEVRAGRLLPLSVSGLPPLYSEMGVVSLRNRSPSPMARHAMQLIGEVAARVNAVPALQPAQRGTGRG